MDRRTQILRAAARRIARNGVRGLRVNDVAAEAGVSPGLLYYHFDDRSGLLGATLDYINTHANDVRSRGVRPETTPYGDLEHQLLSELGDEVEVRENSAAWNELRALAVFEEDLQEPMRVSTDAWVEEVAWSVAAVQRTRPDAAADPVRTATLLTALVEGLSNRWLTGGLTLAEAHSLLAEAIERLVGVPSSPGPDDPDDTTSATVPTSQETP